MRGVYVSVYGNIINQNPYYYQKPGNNLNIHELVKNQQTNISLQWNTNLKGMKYGYTQEHGDSQNHYA